MCNDGKNCNQKPFQRESIRCELSGFKAGATPEHQSDKFCVFSALKNFEWRGT